MGNIVNIAFQGGMHGHFLRYCVDRFSKLTPELTGTPFNENGTSHGTLNYSGLVNLYHPSTNYPHFKNKNEPHILITVEKDDILFIERWVTMRAGDFKIDLSDVEIDIPADSMFLQNFQWKDKFQKYYNIDLTKNSIPKFLMRDFYKLSFLDLDKNGFVDFDIKLKTHKPKNTFCFPVSAFWDKQDFFDTLKEAGERCNLELDLTDQSVHDEFINRILFFDTKDRANNVIKSIQDKVNMDTIDLDIVEQAYISAWIEKNYEFVVVPACDQFFQSTAEIINWLKHYPDHYKAMNPNLPTFNNIPNPFHLWNLKK
jgi:hypothetical protein